VSNAANCDYFAFVVLPTIGGGDAGCYLFGFWSVGDLHWLRLIELLFCVDSGAAPNYFFVIFFVLIAR